MYCCAAVWLTAAGPRRAAAHPRLIIFHLVYGCTARRRCLRPPPHVHLSHYVHLQESLSREGREGGREGGGAVEQVAQGQVRKDEERAMNRAEERRANLSRQETREGFCVKTSGDVNERVGERARDKVASDADVPFGVRSYVSGRSKQTRESPAAASWISLVSPHTPSVTAEARADAHDWGRETNACHIYSPAKLSRVGRKPRPTQTG